jgi:hypothetical protein
VPSRQLVTEISRRFVVLEVNEPYSSQKSVTNHQQVRLATEEDIGRPVRTRNRLFVVDNTLVSGGHRLMLDRDISAALNMVKKTLFFSIKQQ